MQLFKNHENLDRVCLVFQLLVLPYLPLSVQSCQICTIVEQISLIFWQNRSVDDTSTKFGVKLGWMSLSQKNVLATKYSKMAAIFFKMAARTSISYQNSTKDLDPWLIITNNTSIRTHYYLNYLKIIYRLVYHNGRSRGRGGAIPLFLPEMDCFDKGIS